jgi:hypothetical protein
MKRLTENKIILVVRKTRLDELIARFNTQDQASFYITRQGADFSDYLLEDQRYKDCVSLAQQTLAKIGRLQVVDRAYVPNFIFGERDTVVVLGQDGLVANVLKYLTTQPVLGVNPDPDRWEGVLLPFTVGQLGSILPQVFDNQRQVRRVTMAQATLNTGQTLYGVNDLFIGPRSHTSARYSIEIGGRAEQHSSSGVIVSTGLGSTGWLRSILAGAVGIASYLSGEQLQIREKTALEWDSRRLYFSVREPWPSKTSSADIAFGQVTDEEPLTLVSYMPEDGVIFSDGIQSDYVQFNSGTQATISVAEKMGHLVV